MNEVVKQCVRAIKLNKQDIPEKIVIQAVHYALAMACSLRRMVLTGLAEDEVPINYYGITFANSGRGKDLSVSIAMRLIEPIVELYNKKLVSKIVLIQDATIPSLENKGGSESGLIQDRVTLDTLGLGSTNVRVEELVAVIKSPNFEETLNVLTESWQEGKNTPRTFRSYVTPKIKCVPCNCLLYSSPEGFRIEGNRQFESFVDNLSNGLARRSYVVFDESDVEIEEEPTLESLRQHNRDLKESTKLIKSLSEYLFETINRPNNVIVVSDEAELELKKYDTRNKNRVATNPLYKNAVKAEILSRSYKIRRLAGMYAVIDGSDTVSEENIHDAIEWVEMLNKDLIIALNAETPSEKIYDYLSKVGKYSSQTDICKHYKMSARAFKESIDEVYTVAYDNGSVLQTKIFDTEGRVTKYNIVLGRTTESDRMICSVGNNFDDFEKVEIGFRQLPALTKGEYGANYSAGIFLNGKRCIENYIKRQNLIIYDIDDYTSIEDTKIYLSEYRGFISTTKTHNKEKNGKVRERFRVVLVSKFEFNLDVDEYRDTMINFAMFHNLEVDTNAVEPARLYFGNPDAEIIKLEGDKLVDLRAYMPDTREVEKIERAIDYTEAQYKGGENPNGFDKFFLQQTAVGNRNDNLLKYGVALIDKKGFDLESAKAKVLALNAMLPEPLTEREIERTMFKTMMKKTGY